MSTAGYIGECLPEYLMRILELAKGLTKKDLDEVELTEVGELDVPICILHDHFQRFWAAISIEHSRMANMLGKTMMEHHKKPSRIERAIKQHTKALEELEWVKTVFWKKVQELYDQNNEVGSIGIRDGYLLVEVRSQNPLSSLSSFLLASRQ